MHRAAMPPTATPAVMHVARDQDVAKVEDARHTRTQGGVQMPACPLERCLIKISPIRGAVNPANVLTKFTFGSVFIKERKYIMGILHN